MSICMTPLLVYTSKCCSSFNYILVIHVVASTDCLYCSCGHFNCRNATLCELVPILSKAVLGVLTITVLAARRRWLQACFMA